MTLPHRFQAADEHVAFQMELPDDAQRTLDLWGDAVQEYLTEHLNALQLIAVVWCLLTGDIQMLRDISAHPAVRTGSAGTSQAPAGVLSERLKGGHDSFVGAGRQGLGLDGLEARIFGGLTR